MRAQLLFFALVAIFSLASAEIFEGQFSTRRDHSRPQFNEAVNFTYQANLEFHTHNALPFFVYLKDIGDTSITFIQSGLVFDLVTETGGALFTYDIRNTGQNIIDEDASFANLETFTVEQVVSDVAHFVDHIRRAHNGSDAQVIVFGSNFGGSIATWARKKYPHIIQRVYSSSGVFDVELFSYRQYDFLEYAILSVGGEECRDYVTSAFEELEVMALDNRGEEMQHRFNLCNPVNTESPSEVSAFFENRMQLLISYIQATHTHGVRSFCAEMERNSHDPLMALGRWTQHQFTEDINCFDPSYETYVETMRNTDWTAVQDSSFRRIWLFLQCTQLGFFPVTHNQTFVPHTITYEYHLNTCIDVFGEEYRPEFLQGAITSAINEYGGINQFVTSAIYTNGDIDPWLYNGMLVSNAFDAHVFIIDHYAKSADLYSPSLLDAEDLARVKEEVTGILRSWVVQVIPVTESA